MKLLIATSYAPKLISGRSELVSALAEAGYKMTVTGPESFDEVPIDLFCSFNIDYFQMPMSRNKINIISEIKTIIKLVMEVKNRDIQCILVYGIRLFPCVLSTTQITKVFTVCVVNGLGSLFERSSLRNHILRLTSYPILWLKMRHANKVIFQNPDDMKQLKKLRLVRDVNCTLVNGSGVNLLKFKQEPLPSDDIFLMIARITKSKGVFEYIEAAHVIKLRYKNAQFVLAGNIYQDTNDEIKNAITIAEKNGFIKYLGFVNDIADCLRKCRYYVLPSFYREGIPRASLEALAIGRPVITTDSPGCRETVIHGVNGLLVPVHDPHALADAMAWMIDNPEVVYSMSYHSRDIAERKFNVTDVNATIVTLLKSK